VKKATAQRGLDGPRYNPKTHEIYLYEVDGKINLGELLEELSHAMDQKSGLNDAKIRNFGKDVGKIQSELPSMPNRPKAAQDIRNDEWHIEVFERAAERLEKEHTILDLFVDKKDAAQLRRAADDLRKRIEARRQAAMQGKYWNIDWDNWRPN
jgi:hypothetical protein